VKLVHTSIAGVFVVEIEKKEDARGFFARTWDPEEAKKNHLLERFDYACISGNKKKGTLRGMHYQRDPHGETKLVRCTKGTIFDVVIDLRSGSKTYKKWISQELSEENRTALYIPPGCAHGFLTLTENAEVLYMIGGVVNSDAATGVRFDDPVFGVSWPMKPAVISERDAGYPDFQS